MATLQWAPLQIDHLPALVELTRACLEHDGGLPSLAEEPTVRVLYLEGPNLGGWDDLGDLVAAVGLSREGGDVWSAAALVHPAARDQGVGEGLVRWAREKTGGRSVRLRLETVPPQADDMLARAGAVKVFSEQVMRHDLHPVPVLARPGGVRVAPYDASTAAAFHAAYEGSFGTRPGYREVPLQEWVDWLESDPAFLPTRSRVALDRESGAPVGFVTVSRDWVDQVGVVPAWRGRGLGAHLVARSLRTLAKAGSRAVWLCVTVDNPAVELYRRLGFVDAGLRNRYEFQG